MCLFIRSLHSINEREHINKIRRREHINKEKGLYFCIAFYPVYYLSHRRDERQDGEREGGGERERQRASRGN